MALAPEFLAILRCPECKQPLVYFPDGADAGDEPFLLCPASRRRYPVAENDLPVLLVDEAEKMDEDQVERLLDRARELGIDVP